MARTQDSEDTKRRNREIGLRIARFRQEAHFSQQALADRVSQIIGKPVPKVTLAHWENPKHTSLPTSTVLDAVASALGIKPEALRGIPGAPEETPYQMALQRLERKAAKWRLEEFSQLPAQRVKAAIDAAVAAYRDSKEDPDRDGDGKDGHRSRPIRSRTAK